MKISIVIACYNEQDNIEPLADKIISIMDNMLSDYKYELIFIDNDSTDKTRLVINKLCMRKRNVKAIFNVHNFGSVRSSVYGLYQATGDCIIKMCADFQDPPELIVDFVKEWEKGYKIVLAIKESSDENKLKYCIRMFYYKLIRKITDIDHIDNFVGYGLYDKDFIQIVKDLNDPMPYLRGIVAELGYKYSKVYYKQPKRKSGKSKFNFFNLYDYAMLGITSYSKVPLRIATFVGLIIAGISFCIGIWYLIMKIMNWDKFNVGIAPMVIGIFFLGALQLLFMGLMGEYILNINIKVSNRPLVIEEQRVNFDENDEEKNEKI